MTGTSAGTTANLTGNLGRHLLPLQQVSADQIGLPYISYHPFRNN